LLNLTTIDLITISEDNGDVCKLSDLPVNEIRGVGPTRSTLLRKLGITSVLDLILHRPRRYEDRRNFVQIKDLKKGDTACVKGKVVVLGVKKFAHGRRSLFELVIDDGSGRLHCIWWNQPYMSSYFNKGDDLIVFGKVTSDRPKTMDNPETETLNIEQAEPESNQFIHLNRIVPVYPATEGLSQRWLRETIWQVINKYAGYIKDDFPEITASGFPQKPLAIRNLHFPDQISDAELATKRLALDEFVSLFLQIQIRLRKFEKSAKAPDCSGTNEKMRLFLKKLGFSLTDAQIKVLREIRADLRGPKPMRRLLQGDVGCGKTVVAGCAAIMAIEKGFNVLFMVPTEILAEQHYNTFRRWFDPIGIDVVLRTGSVKNNESGPSLFDIAENYEKHSGASKNISTAKLFIGTHALIEESFIADNIGLIIIDEQHKFGVAQREKLVKKGRNPHLLVMTATPIPRTLALTIYGDLDCSIIDQMPAGRSKIITKLVNAGESDSLWKFVRQQLANGKQAYIVCPRVESDPASEIKAVKTEYVRIKKLLAPFEVALVHGEIPREEREKIMDAFRSGAVSVLVATTVIEVGVDVPNATVMVIENAERFGLAQLHQLRGRIGRGVAESYCFLVASPRKLDKAAYDALKRLNVLVQTSNGFEIAEADLQMRGPGELLGQAQSGLPSLKFADFIKDFQLITQAKEIARSIISKMNI